MSGCRGGCACRWGKDGGKDGKGGKDWGGKDWGGKDWGKDFGGKDAKGWGKGKDAGKGFKAGPLA